ncbi:leucine-rich repeat and IQ domain-containing protein 4-like isoform X2 [Pristis pectinata]|uniref:leucine-rich repeat and IQ domain-containing protein 4-like isoform X2 n=1 Tax=Pristis pectinata TaxID=685728 RepID=UPI00223CFA40|nr:leucine-rich repeat and IQ domain-containing protein 4-like isoform X2 [Pristis pectinata]
MWRICGELEMSTVGRCGSQADINFRAVTCLLGASEASPDVVQLLRGHILFQDLGSTGLHFIPPAVLRLQYLEELHLEGNQIEEIPPEIGSLQKLRVLYLNNNKLSSICDQLVDCQNLQSLDLSDNPLDCGIPTQTLCRLQALRELRLSNLNLVQLPAQICKKLHHLQLLGLSGNNLTTLPCEIRNLTQLQQLHLKNNKLHGLPPGFCQLPKLEVLNLRQNLLNCLPDDIGSLKNLKHLYLSHNQLTTIPESLGKCCSMCALDISGNRLHSNLKAFPASLTELAVSENQLHIFPTAICNLADSLQLLYLKNTQLKKLSCCFSNLTEIRLLDLSQNPLRYFPKQICDLAQMEMLSLDDSKLKENLKELYIENNEIEFLPSTIGLLQNLTVLDCHENRLLKIPDSISDIHGLQKLLLNCNRISLLPENLDHLQNLEILSLERNPLEKPLDEICLQGVSAIFQYLQTKKIQKLNATKIQAWWRGLMVRKELGPFQNLFPKKDKKGKKDKKNINKGKKK